MRKELQFILDVSWFGMAALASWLIRLGFGNGLEMLGTVLPYFAISVAVAVPVFRFFRLRAHSYRFFSPHDFLQMVLVVTLALLLAVSVSFGLFRLEGIHRSLPVLHWVVAILGFSLLRFLAYMSANGTANRKCQGDTRVPVLIIGYSPLAEVLLRLLQSEQGGGFVVAGILDEDRMHLGLHLRQSKVIGHPAELPQIMAQLAIHGMPVKKIVLATDRAVLSAQSRATLSRLEEEARLEVMDFVQQTAVFFDSLATGPVPEPVAAPDCFPVPRALWEQAEAKVAAYAPLKRLFDVVAASILGVLALPVLVLVVPAIWASMGAPFYFWQERPGRNGKVFRLYKLRTLGHGVGPDGNILGDDERQTGVGRLLRRTRLDEIPQILNVLRGDMSFVGPRPLLPADLPEGMPDWVRLRSMVRPGITGWAQINGGQAVSKEDKLILDAWYISHMTLWTDLRIIWGTFKVVAGGEVLDHATIRAAYLDLGVAGQDAAPLLG